jgi:hypothetical protein
MNYAKQHVVGDGTYLPVGFNEVDNLGSRS